jgi:hypothetical protein
MGFRGYCDSNAVATCIIICTLFQRYVWIGGINGTGFYPIWATIAVLGLIGGAGYFLVCAYMQNTRLIKG